MRVILLDNIPNVGKAGEEKTVKDGYYRNYLLPRKLALESTPKNRKLLEQKRLQMQRIAVKELQDARMIAERLDTITLTARLKAGEGDRLFGSVTAGDIADMLKEKGFEIDKKRIEITETLNKLGLYTVHVHLHPEIMAKVKVLVEKEL